MLLEVIHRKDEMEFAKQTAIEYKSEIISTVELGELISTLIRVPNDLADKVKKANEQYLIRKEIGSYTVYSISMVGDIDIIA